MNDGHISARRTVRPRVVGVNGQVPQAPHPDDEAAIRSNMPNIRPFAPSPQVTDPERIVRSAARRAHNKTRKTARPEATDDLQHRHPPAISASTQQNSHTSPVSSNFKMNDLQCLRDCEAN
ncbi:hypothetical protein [Streptomyces sp. NBC_00063]|uniref:hypothetical protein n=1 Tax=Streptomyces sp. NBC_00063 TaxID=2975638 RepID=UPI003D70F1E1